MDHVNGQDHEMVGNGSPAPFYQIQVNRNSKEPFLGQLLAIIEDNMFVGFPSGIFSPNRNDF
jgi:hypothetical protein